MPILIHLIYHYSNRSMIIHSFATFIQKIKIVFIVIIEKTDSEYRDWNIGRTQKLEFK